MQLSIAAGLEATIGCSLMGAAAETTSCTLGMFQPRVAACPGAELPARTWLPTIMHLGARSLQLGEPTQQAWGKQARSCPPRSAEAGHHIWQKALHAGPGQLGEADM